MLLVGWVCAGGWMGMCNWLDEYVLVVGWVCASDWMGMC